MPGAELPRYRIVAAQSDLMAQLLYLVLTLLASSISCSSAATGIDGGRAAASRPVSQIASMSAIAISDLVFFIPPSC